MRDRVNWPGLVEGDQLDAFANKALCACKRGLPEPPANVVCAACDGVCETAPPDCNEYFNCLLSIDVTDRAACQQCYTQTIQSPSACEGWYHSGQEPYCGRQ